MYKMCIQHIFSDQQYGTKCDTEASFEQNLLLG